MWLSVNKYVESDNWIVYKCAADGMIPGSVPALRLRTGIHNNNRARRNRVVHATGLPRSH